jgi:class 3 adenylate cyclase
MPADDDDFRRLTSFLRASASPGAVAQLARMNVEIDIRHVLPTVRVPTLLLHRTDDVIPIANARYIAAHVPGARFLELPGRDHLPWLEPEQWIAPAEEFLREAWETSPWEHAEPDRVLATVLFTDIVDSTAKAVELGDSRWRELVADHHIRVRRELARFRGRELDTAGDGFFASFDGPARAIRCACAIRESVRGLGIDIRAGLHTGECEQMEGKVGGIAVITGARVAAQAGANEVLVSATVRDLVAGSGLEFQDRGVHALKGLPEERRLYAVA